MRCTAAAAAAQPLRGLRAPGRVVIPARPRRFSPRLRGASGGDDAPAGLSAGEPRAGPGGRPGVAAAFPPARNAVPLRRRSPAAAPPLPLSVLSPQAGRGPPAASPPQRAARPRGGPAARGRPPPPLMQHIIDNHPDMATALLAGEKLKELILPGQQDDKAGALAALLLQLKLELPFDRVVTIGTVLIPILLVTLVFTKNFAGKGGGAPAAGGVGAP